MKKSLFVGEILFLIVILNFVSSSHESCPEGYTIKPLPDNSKVCISPPEINSQGYPIPFTEKSLPISCSENYIFKKYGGGGICISSQETSSNVVEAGNIQSNLQSKMGSSTGITSSVSGEAKSLASGSDSLYVLDDFALRQELDNPLDFKKKEDCNKSNGCYFEGDCFLTEDIINSNYCFKGEFIPQKSWGNLCEQDFECLEGFCFEGKCYRGGKDNYLKNKNKELEKRLENLENTINQKDNTTKTNSITGAVIDNSVGKQSWIVRIWRKFFG